MAQDSRKGPPPSTPGRSPAPSAPDTPDTRAVNAPPPPEAPEADETSGDEPPAQPGGAMAGDGSTDSGEAPEESESERLRREIDAAREALEAKEAELARVEAQRQADEAAAKMVSDYSAELPALKASERDLRQYQTAETKFLNEILPAAARDAIAELHKGPEKEIADLRTEIEKKERASTEARRALGEAREDAAGAKERVEGLKRPAASIRDRIKRADAIRAEAMKASDAGRYAFAYWLVMPGGSLERAIAAEPAIIPTEHLGDRIKAAAAEQKEADERVATLTTQVETIEAGLQKDRTKLAELQRGLDSKILAQLSKLNPQTAAAA